MKGKFSNVCGMYSFVCATKTGDVISLLLTIPTPYIPRIFTYISTIDTQRYDHLNMVSWVEVLFIYYIYTVRITGKHTYEHKQLRNKFLVLVWNFLDKFTI